ncbi:MAG: DUF5320 domain-containing protein [Bacteroidales bacterium]|nr:DUF5320 domain-containing protein [Bacteroidales bacterium]
MPGFDRTGPEGEGPRTGRALGKCDPKTQTPGKDVKGEESPDERGFGRGFGRGRNFGRGRFRGGGGGFGRNR